MEGARERQIMSQEFAAEVAQIEMRRGNQAAAEALLSEIDLLPSVAVLDHDPWMLDLQRFDATGAMDSMQADRLREGGRLTEAATLFSRLASRFPQRSRPGMNHAMLLATAGNHAAAQDELKRLVSRFPDDPLIFFNLAFVQFELGSFDQAESNLMHATRLKGDFGAAWGALADLYVRTQRFELADEAFQRAIEIVPEQIDTRFAYAEFLISRNRNEAALQSLEDAAPLVLRFPEYASKRDELKVDASGGK